MSILEKVSIGKNQPLYVEITLYLEMRKLKKNTKSNGTHNLYTHILFFAIV